MPKISQRQFAAVLIAALAARVFLTATTIGTNDVIFKIMWARLADTYGIAHAYAHNRDLNHPPLSLLLMHGFDLLARRIGLQYTDVFRHAQSLADVVTAAALLRIGKSEALARLPFDPRFPAVAYFLSPAVIFVSAFHCNTDATMVALLTVAVMFAIEERPAASGIFIAAAVGIKIVALFAGPFLFLFLAGRRSRLSFIGAFAIVSAAIFLPAALIGGPAVLRNIFTYSGFPGKWGITAVLVLLRAFPLALAYATYGRYVVVAALGALFVIFLRGQRDAVALCTFIAMAYVATLFLAPGFGVQYLIWPLPLLPIAAGKGWALAIHAASAAYLFISYTIWSHGLPWWYADAITPTPLKPWVTYLSIPLWALLGYALFHTVRSFRDHRSVAEPRPASNGA